ncbi:hypothetical protein A9K65_033630 (plasmid) [Mesorhizobium sp. WSM1497]|uniref:Uncharacterized protein n=1 Tax=Mesorhizobium ciceri biovar biserrulae (strain HAMBI 2942 / LMG 23838 / WSM1271) TaxID=765698 RepID=E8TPQ1_MESCW|nr:hypothetical protein Mesci_6297 [Mesorhizobium ciceri biovar biserrulae WSM1271]ARP68317.1 hypothetical protein A9K65_033630 [Mesorhizobium sp. WSM1497]RUZ73838.1 hypothetical protein EN943_26005 [Mesorhizobium sp. M7A.F.Ca.US.006.01.1.1]
MSAWVTLNAYALVREHFALVNAAVPASCSGISAQPSQRSNTAGRLTIAGRRHRLAMTCARGRSSAGSAPDI